MQKYIWYWNDHAVSAGTANEYVAYNLGWYFASLTDYFGCIDTTRMVFIDPTGISDQALNSSIRLYPNPTTGKLILQTTGAITHDINLSVFNVLGKEIINQTFKVKDIQTIKEIDISGQPAGTYTVIIRYQNTNLHQLIKKE
jgi:hypothetical protein